MSWNNGKEKKIFIEKQEIQAKKYKLYGMDEEGIQAMYKYDEETFKSERRFVEHNCSPFTLTGNETFEMERENNFCLHWVDTIENELLLKKLKKLSKEELAILTMIVMKGFSQVETASILKVSYRTIKRKYEKIVKLLK